MKLKLDENIGRRGFDLLERAGHDVATVPQQGLGGAPDQALFEICGAEGRTLITLDRDFGQVPRFPPRQSAGIVILEVGQPATLQGITGRLRDFLALAATQSVVGSLWIVEPGRVRVHLESDS